SLMRVGWAESSRPTETHNGDGGPRRLGPPYSVRGIPMSTPSLSRRDWLRLSAAGVVGYSMSGWLQSLAGQTANDPRRQRSCILLWMNGGPSQMDTFDLKPGHANGGPFRAIQTAADGVRISEHLPRLARQMQHAAVIRAMNTR